MARGRKPAKRIKIEIEMEMSNTAYQQTRTEWRDMIEGCFPAESKIVYFAIGAEDKD